MQYTPTMYHEQPSTLYIPAGVLACFSLQVLTPHLPRQYDQAAASQPFGALGPYARCMAVRAARSEGRSCVTTLAARYSRRPGRGNCSTQNSNCHQCRTHIPSYIHCKCSSCRQSIHLHVDQKSTAASCDRYRSLPGIGHTIAV